QSRNQSRSRRKQCSRQLIGRRETLQTGACQSEEISGPKARKTNNTAVQPRSPEFLPLELRRPQRLVLLLLQEPFLRLDLRRISGKTQLYLLLDHMLCKMPFGCLRGAFRCGGE